MGRRTGRALHVHSEGDVAEEGLCVPFMHVVPVQQLPYIDGWDVKVVPDPAAVRVAFESQQSFTYGAKNRAGAPRS